MVRLTDLKQQKIDKIKNFYEKSKNDQKEFELTKIDEIMGIVKNIDIKQKEFETFVEESNQNQPVLLDIGGTKMSLY